MTDSQSGTGSGIRQFGEQVGEDVVFGVFSSAEEAQSAIYALRDEGFGPSQVGAAFHSSEFAPKSGSGGAGQNVTRGTLGTSAGTDRSVAHTVSPGVSTAGSGATGARSDTSAVTPAGLATGAGTQTTGASRPGPIPGTEHASLRGKTDLHAPLESSANVPAGGVFPSTGGFSDESAAPAHETLWGKLKHFFGGAETGAKRGSTVATDSSLNFGTGEGHLGVSQPATPSPSATDGGIYGGGSYDEQGAGYDADYEYPAGELEGSFYGMGIPEETARVIALQVGRGGAVVTVKAGTRTQEAERILERHNARMGHDLADSTSGGGPTDVDRDQSPGQNRVVLFGEALRTHRRLPENASVEERKAS